MELKIGDIIRAKSDQYMYGGNAISGEQWLIKGKAYRINAYKNIFICRVS